MATWMAAGEWRVRWVVWTKGGAWRNSRWGIKACTYHESTGHHVRAQRDLGEVVEDLQREGGG